MDVMQGKYDVECWWLYFWFPCQMGNGQWKMDDGRRVTGNYLLISLQFGLELLITINKFRIALGILEIHVLYYVYKFIDMANYRNWCNVLLFKSQTMKSALHLKWRKSFQLDWNYVSVCHIERVQKTKWPKYSELIIMIHSEFVSRGLHLNHNNNNG